MPFDWFLDHLLRNTYYSDKKPNKRSAKKRNRFRPRLETLEDRLAPATAIAPYNYIAGAGEFNEVVLSPGTPFSSIQDAPDVNQITAPPFVASRFLDGIGIDISFGVGFALEDPGPQFDVAVGVGFPLYPFGLPEGVLGPPLASTGSGGFDVNDLIGDAVQQAVGGVSSAVAGVPVPATHNTGDGIDFEVRAVNDNTLPGYRLFQAIVDPGNTVAESESNDTAATADAISPREIVTGAVAPGSGDLDVFRFTATATRFFSVVLDNNPDGDGDFTGTEISILVDVGGGTNPALERSNVTFGDANAVGPIEASAGDDIYVLVENSEAGDDNDGDYRFVLIENNPANFLFENDEVNETEANDDQTSTDSLSDRTDYAFGTIPSELDRDFFRVTEGTDSGGSANANIDTGDLIFAFVDVIATDDGGTADDRMTDELDSFLTVFEPPSSGGAQIADDDNDGPAMPATTFNQILNEIEQLVDFGALTSVFNGTVTVETLDGDDIVDAHKVGLTSISADLGTGNDIIQGGGGATITINGGDGEDVLEIPGTDANDVISVIMAGANLVVSANGTTSTFPNPTSVESLQINGFDGDDLITVNLSGGAFPFSSGISVSGGGSIDEIRVIDGAMGHTAIFRQREDQHDGEIEFVGLNNVDFDSVEEWSITPLDPVFGGSGGIGGDFAGRIVVIDEDPLEYNDDLLNATPIEYLENLIENLAIDLPAATNRPADEDYFKFIAPKTGTYRFDALFRRLGTLANGNPGLPGDGELTISVLDTNGDLIVHGRPNALGVSASFSALQGRTYYLRVQGGTEAITNTDSVNSYQLRFAAIDLLGPQVFDPDNGGPMQAIQVVTAGVPNENFNLFDVKPNDGPPNGGPTPRVDALKINLRDLISLNPMVFQRAPGDVYPALDDFLAQLAANYSIVGDRVGNIAIDSITVMNDLPVINGQVVVATSNSQFTDPGLAAGPLIPEPGDFVIMTSGAAQGQIREIDTVIGPGTTLNFGADPFIGPFPTPAPNDTFQVLKIATAMVTLNFAEPLPDDRYTLTISDELRDPACNLFDGESNAVQPVGTPAFPSGNGFPGGSFVARFTVDSRPEIGQWEENRVQIDINGNGVWDPEATGDDTNRDLAFDFGRFTDFKFAGNFAPLGAGIATGFDKLGAYGRVNGQFRFLLDFNHDGVADANIRSDPIDGTPVAGDFTNGHPGDEVGIFDGTTWFLDTSGNNRIDGGDRRINNGLRGHPIVGDFDGDGLDDLATYQPDNDRFQFDLAIDGFGGVDATINYGHPSVQERPVAADLNLDGVDDIGLWVPGTFSPEGDVPTQWYWLVSDGPTPGSVNSIRPPFRPEPFGNDLYFNFGNTFALPLIGNFDPPTSNISRSTSRVDTILAPGTGYVRNVSVQADVVHFGQNSSVGLVVRHLRQGIFYWGGLTKNAGDAQAEIWRVYKGQWTKLAEEAVSGGFEQIRFEAVGSGLTLYVNGVLKAETSDTWIADGMVGTQVTDGNIMSGLQWTEIERENVTLVYEDAFDRPDGGILARSWTETAGAFRIENASAVSQRAASTATLFGLAERDVAVETDVLSFDSGSVGLLARYQDAGTSYWGGLVKSAGSMRAEIWRLFNGNWRLLAAQRVSATARHLRFEIAGSLLQLYVDDVLAVYSRDSWIAADGTVGLQAARGAVMDNFRAENLPPNPGLPTVVDAEALGQRYGFRFGGNWYLNSYKQNEKWFQDRYDSWYFITDNGTIYKWNGRDFAGSLAIAVVDPLVHADPKQALFPVLFRNTSPAELRQHYNFHSNGDLYFNYTGQREKWFQDENDNWFFITPDGSLFQWNSINMGGVSAVAFLNSVVYNDLGQLLRPLHENATAAQLHDLYDFQFTGNYYFDYYGLGEKWFRDRNSAWYFITASGTLYRFSGGRYNFIVVAFLDSSVYADPGSELF